MPAFTHVLGPIVALERGKFQTRLTRRLSIVRELIDQLPHSHFVKLAIDPSREPAFAVADSLAFQERGYRVGLQCNFELQTSDSLETIWGGMSTEARQHIRVAEKQYTVVATEPEPFVQFYNHNSKIVRMTNQIDSSTFHALHAECRVRGCGIILAAKLPDGSMAAMTFLVWDKRRMYYLLATRAKDARSGSASLLIWYAVQRAKELGLIFDFDGVSSEGIAQFYSGFGAGMTTRHIVSYSKPIYAAANFIRKTVFRPTNDTSNFT